MATRNCFARGRSVGAWAWIWVLLIGGLPAARVGRAQSEAWRLAGIEVEGLKALNLERVRLLSGLTLGQSVGLEDLEGAAQKLLESGFFHSVSFRYQYQGEAVTVIFRVEEGDVGVPVIFDNFVWFSEEEVRRAVRSQIPRFDGSAPPGDESVSAIQDGLRLLLHARGIRTQIRSETIEDPETGRATALLFRADVDLPICGVRFPHLRTVSEDVLLEKASPLEGEDYSRSRVQSFAEKNLLPLFHAAGRLRAEFQTPTAVPRSDADCPGGVVVNLPVVEGYAYRWEKAQWSGSILFSDKELSAALGMKHGEIAAAPKIDQGLQAIRQAYAAKGIAKVAIQVSPLYNEDVQTVTYRISIEERP